MGSNQPFASWQQGGAAPKICLQHSDPPRVQGEQRRVPKHVFAVKKKEEEEENKRTMDAVAFFYDTENRKHLKTTG